MIRIGRGESDDEGHNEADSEKATKAFPVERLNDLHDDLLSVDNTTRQGRAFLFPQTGGSQAQKSLRSSVGGGDEGWTAPTKSTE